MGIKLDWKVEAEGGWAEVGEDEAVLEVRRRRAQQLRQIGLGVLAVGLLIAAGIIWRLYAVEQQLRKNLEATIIAETSALRIGDLNGFLQAQSTIGEWDRIQRRTFADYHELGNRLSGTSTIVSMDIRTDQAQVVLEETIDG